MSVWQVFRRVLTGWRSRRGAGTTARAWERRTIPRLEALEQRDLLSASPINGSGIGLLAQYFAQTNLTRPVLTRLDATVNFDLMGGSPAPGVAAHNFSVRWSGQVEPRYSEDYSFATFSDDGIRLWVNHELIIDDWTDHATKEDVGTIALEAGRKYDIKMDYYENPTGPAVAKLDWSSASEPQAVIPQSQLFPPPMLPTSLAGFVYLDRNRNGSRDAGEAGIAQVGVTLAGIDDLGQEVQGTILTAADGSYRFADLRPGTYSIAVNQPPAYTQGLPKGGKVSGIALREGISGTGYDFAELGATLSGTVFLDAGGGRALGVSGLAGARLVLQDGRGQVIAGTTTTADGSYAFPDLPAGSYRIVETLPAGYGASTTEELTVEVSLAGLTGQDFRATTASVSGVVSRDPADGVKVPGISGIAGAVVTLTGTDDSGQAITRTTTTAADGSYRFSGLLGGVYTLTETLAAGSRDADDAPPPPRHTLSVVLVAGASKDNLDFHEQTPRPPVPANSPLPPRIPVRASGSVPAPLLLVIDPGEGRHETRSEQQRSSAPSQMPTPADANPFSGKVAGQFLSSGAGALAEVGDVTDAVPVPAPVAAVTAAAPHPSSFEAPAAVEDEVEQASPSRVSVAAVDQFFLTLEGKGAPDQGPLCDFVPAPLKRLRRSPSSAGPAPATQRAVLTAVWLLGSTLAALNMRPSNTLNGT
jgi:hypothetical protein